MPSIEYILTGVAILLLLSVVASKASDRLGVPALLIFMIIGMLAGSDGPGGIHFNDPYAAQFMGVIALAFILFAGGLSTDWESVKPVIWPSIILSTLGVFLTALFVGIFAILVLDFSLLEGLLLGSIISSTDAAAVFSVLRSRNVSLKGNLKPLLELESGSNDPMAVLLTTGVISMINTPGLSLGNMIPLFIYQMAFGAFMGLLMGYGIVKLLNTLKLEYEGLYPVLSIALVILTYSATTVLKGNGFLAVYIAALVMGKTNFIHKKSLTRFHDGLAWLMQIAMFLTLGLLVFPKSLPPVIITGVLVSIFLIFIARPVGVFISTIGTKISLKEKTMISWVGLRGAVPIVLATFPLVAKIPHAEIIFNIVFFIVLTSALLQGSTIPFVARLLRVDAPLRQKTAYPIECDYTGTFNCDIKDILVPDNSAAVNKRLLELNLPQGSLIALIKRKEDFFVPAGGTELKAGDKLLVLADNENFAKTHSIINLKQSDQ
ncbi:MAG: potassium/proton antiporter [Dissulfurispiraceae bacterium]|jgi:cell volume regulation protein A|nr:potassium/proton antiporter [Dissulfurispiraceae bacterium]